MLEKLTYLAVVLLIAACTFLYTLSYFKWLRQTKKSGRSVVLLLGLSSLLTPPSIVYYYLFIFEY